MYEKSETQIIATLNYISNYFWIRSLIEILIDCLTVIFIESVLNIILHFYFIANNFWNFLPDEMKNSKTQVMVQNKETEQKIVPNLQSELAQLPFQNDLFHYIPFILPFLYLLFLDCKNPLLSNENSLTVCTQCTYFFIPIFIHFIFYFLSLKPFSLLNEDLWPYPVSHQLLHYSEHYDLKNYWSILNDWEIVYLHYFI